MNPQAWALKAGLVIARVVRNGDEWTEEEARDEVADIIVDHMPSSAAEQEVARLRGDLTHALDELDAEGERLSRDAAGLRAQSEGLKASGLENRHSGITTATTYLRARLLAGQDRKGQGE